MARDVLICKTTQMALLPASRQPAFRLADPEYGPLQPRRRSVSSSDDRANWHRFDLAGERTIYAASSMEGAYAELLEPFKKPAPRPASQLFDDAGEGETVDELIAHDLAAAGKNPAREIDADWLHKYRLYTLLLPSQGWLVDAEHSKTVAYLHANRSVALLEQGLTQVTVSDLRSERRFVTSHLAEVMARPRLYDESRPIGLRFGSKYGSDWECWAMWLRDGVHNEIAVDAGHPIAHPDQNPVLRKVLDMYGLSAH